MGIKLTNLKNALLGSVMAFGLTAQAQVYMEIESVAPKGDWKLETTKAGFQGTGYFYWHGGNKYGDPSTTSALTYSFTIQEAGKYHIDFRGRRDHEGECAGAASDECNDVFSKLDNQGWYKTMMKGPWGSWHWQGSIEDHSLGVIRAEYNLTAGNHTLTVSGRSEGVILDAIAIYKVGTTRPTSPTGGGNTGGGTGTTPTDIADLSTTVNGCSVLLAWSDTEGETAYRIRRKADGEAAFTNLTDVNAGVTSFLDENLNPNTTYVYQVRPVLDGAAVASSNFPVANVLSCDGNTGGNTGGGSTGGDCEAWFNPNGIWQGKGRIAISSDGNEHDKDDWAATPFSLALLASKGLQDKLTLYTFSDHIWGSNLEHSDAAQQMRTSALQGKTQFGFDNSNFIEAVANPSAAYAAMTAEINKSTAADPLFIIAAGPMQVVGKAINDANVNKLQYVTIISHSLWNDKHSDNSSNEPSHTGWTWDEIENTFKSKGLNVVHITDQNGGTGYDGMRADKSKFAWLLNDAARNNALYKTGSWQWLYDRQVAAQKNQEFDPSDAGMIIYLLTGKEKTDPVDAKNLMIDPVAKCSSDNTGGGNTGGGTCTEVVNLNGINDFETLSVNGFVPAYKDAARGAIAVNSVQHGDSWSAAKTTFTGDGGTYNITLTTLTEIDGESKYKVKVNGNLVGEFQNPKTTTDYAPAKKTWNNIMVAKGDVVQVEFQAHTNGDIPEGDGTAFSRGRWTDLKFECTGDDNSGGNTGGTGGNTGTCNGFEEKNGLLVIEMENTTFSGNWKKRTAIADASGGAYVQWEGSESFNSAANGHIEIPITINTPGTYEFRMRVAIGDLSHGTTEHNDTWLKIEADQFYAEKNGVLIKPKPDCNNSAGYGCPEGSSVDGFFKMFGGGQTWQWQNKTSDFDDHFVHAKFNSAGNYKIIIAARSNYHAIDRIIMYNTAISNRTAAQNLANSETKCSGNDGGNTGGGSNYVSIPSRIEAEDYVNQSGVELAPTTDVDGVDHIRKITSGDFVTFDVNALFSGEYTLKVRYTAGGQGGKVKVFQGNSQLGILDLPSTGAWGVWDTKSITIDLIEGNQTIKLEFVDNDISNEFSVDVNWIEFMGTVTGVEIENKEKIMIYPNPSTGILNLSGVNGQTWTVYNVLGEVVLFGNEDVIDLSAESNGNYVIRILDQVYQVMKN